MYHLFDKFAWRKKIVYNNNANCRGTVWLRRLKPDPLNLFVNTIVGSNKPHRRFPCYNYSKEIIIMKNAVAIVTGASRGLGHEIARQLVQKNYHVVANYYNTPSGAQQLVDEFGANRVIAVKADVRNKEEMAHLHEETIKAFGQVDVIIHNALINFKFDPTKQLDLAHISWENYLTQLEGSVQGALNLLQTNLESLKKSENPRFIAIGTNLFQSPVVPYHEYTTGKGALLGFMRNCAAELGKFGITCNMVSGGLLKTTDASSVTTPEVFDLIAQVTALKRVTTPSDLAEMVCFLAGKESKGISGQNIVVDSGQTFN